MTIKEQEKNAKDFAEFWKDKGYEKGQSQSFWLQLLSQVFGIEKPTEFIEFEDQVHIDKATGFIDGFIDKTKVLIEQKSIDKDLRKAIKQSDGSLLNPFQQAKRYSAELPYDSRPRWIVTCNFKSFLVYDMNNPNGEPEEILLKDLPKEYYRLSFLVDSKSEHIKKEEELSFKAGELVGRLYNAFYKEYKDITNEQSQKDLNELCVRLVFCLYAEDAGLFGRKNIFHDYLAKYEDLTLMRENLIKLFKILDTKEEDRDPYLEDDLNQFPYVNGGLFSNENIEIPKFTNEIRNTLLAKASDEFNWSEISPTIFGAVFESTLNPDTRRSGGMHYTSIENIHKVIDPLFLDDLRERLNKAESYKNEKTRNEELRKFQEYLGTLKFFDPACGSGNFLTETYLSLRRLENEALDVIQGGMMNFDMEGKIKVSIQQFYGIEINDFAVKVAKTALWIAEAQMFQETKKILYKSTELNDILPLETYENIVEGNALRIDWNDVLSNTECNYIMGNPPFVGFYLQTEDQKNDLKYITEEQTLDYVTCWFFKAAEFMNNTKIKAAFVSTNSISQGEQVALIWDKLIKRYNTIIDFAYKTFNWTSEAKDNAKVHCVIIGFSDYNDMELKTLYDQELKKKVENISPYLLDCKTILIKNRNKPICNVPELNLGNRPLDGQQLLLTEEEYEKILHDEPQAEKWIRPFLGSTEFINNKKRYCLWLVDITPNELMKLPNVLARVEKCREIRLKAKDKQMNKLAETPTLFREQKTSNNDYIVLPRVSSSRRRYMPIGYISHNIIAGDALQMLPKAGLYEFGILTSNVHNSWLRAVGGRLKSDYRYGKETVYNTFPWPNPTKEQKDKIYKTAEAIIKARKKYSQNSLSDMYGDKMYLFPEVLKAHQMNDVAVMEAYGFDWRKMTESECVAELMKMYQDLIN